MVPAAAFGAFNPFCVRTLTLGILAFLNGSLNFHLILLLRKEHTLVVAPDALIRIESEPKCFLGFTQMAVILSVDLRATGLHILDEFLFVEWFNLILFN